MSGCRRHRSRAWAVLAVGMIVVCGLLPAPAFADARTGSVRDSAGIAAPPRSLLPLAMHAAAAAAPDYAHAVWEPASPANYTVADRPFTSPIVRLVIHVAEGGWSSTYQWFRDPRAEASAHYVVSSAGRVAQMVPNSDIAWHAGNWAYNETSIGIEHAGYTNRTRFPDAEYRGSARLAAWLADTYLIVPDRRHVIGHSQVPDPNHSGEWGGVDHHTDPGRTWDWPRYMAYLRSDAADTPQRVLDNADAGRVRFDPSVWRVGSSQRGRYGRNYLVARPGRSTGPVLFKVAVPATDGYDLMMRWPCGADSTRVGVGIATARGYRSTRVDESRGCGRFQYIGSYRLTAGDSWRLQVSSVSKARGPIVADAFKLVEQSDPAPPTAPVVTPQPGETQIGISWTRGRDNVAVGGYRLVVDGALEDPRGARTLTVTGLTCDTVHTVSVRAVDLAGNMSPKHLAWVRTGACPPPPTGLTATPHPHTVDLTWSAPAGGLTYVVLANGRDVAATASTAATVGNLKCATTHTFGVESVDASGSVSDPATVDVTTPAC